MDKALTGIKTIMIAMAGGIMGNLGVFSFWLFVSKFSTLSIFLFYTEKNNETYFYKRKGHMLETF